METIKCIKERRSIRKFEDKPIPPALIEEIVETARFAPSWKNTQIVRYIVVCDKETKKKLASDECTYSFTFNQNTILGASALVVLTYVKGKSGFDKDGSYSTPLGDRWQNFDCGISAQTFCLTAHEKGLGTTIMGYFDPEAIKKTIAIPDDEEVGALIVIGYPAESPTTKRKEVSELVTFI